MQDKWRDFAFVEAGLEEYKQCGSPSFLQMTELGYSLFSRFESGLKCPICCNSSRQVLLP